MKYTKEDLMNTWGVVESKEHAEYIVKVAKCCGIKMGDIDGHDFGSFSIDGDGLYLWYSKESGSEYCLRQITIPLPTPLPSPLPPKEWKTPTPPKHFDCVCAKCGGKCCAGFCDDWPQVGEEVLICDKANLLELSRFNGKKCKVIGVCSDGDDKVLTVKAKHQGVAAFNMGDWIKKPKSKQDLLIEDLHQKLLANNCSDEYLLACDIVQGKIEGLSYE